jgi:two-component system, chemotaxis family, protein-glutamate methylesterase/glutaminase
MKRGQALTAVPRRFRYSARAVAIGASAGGIAALLPTLSALRADFPLPLILVMHRPEDGDNLLRDTFANRMALAVREPADKEPLVPRHLYIAPAGYHLLLESDLTFALSCDPPEHFSRPSIDVLLESAADALGESLVAILLTGANADGAEGMARVAAAGGLTVVQDPKEAQSADMPLAAIAARPPDFVLNLEQIRALLATLVLSDASQTPDRR